MKDANQPQTTRTPTVRDAAVQIGSEEKPKLTEESFRRGHAIYEGLRLWNDAEKLTIEQVISFCAIHMAMLTSQSKNDREGAKARIRNLIKLGTEAAK